MNYHDLISCFRDTLRVAQETLAEETARMQAGTALYLPGFQAPAPRVKSEGLALEVTEDTTFHCARQCGIGKTAVLNFANAYRPGGGVANGAMAQEECLCRSSNLYLSLTLPDMVRDYYQFNQKTTGALGTDAVIYSPGVTVFKSDDPLPVPLPATFRVDVLTCAAPHNGPYGFFSESELFDVFVKRVRNIVEAAAANDADTLILGAFGCGAFHNPPDTVAAAFRTVLRDQEYRRYFQRIVFAIKRNDQVNSNYLAFARVLGEA